MYLLKRTENICLGKDLYTNVHSKIIQKSQKKKNGNNQNVGELINKMYCINTMEYHSEIKTNKILIHTTWINLTIVPNERS